MSYSQVPRGGLSDHGRLCSDARKTAARVAMPVAPSGRSTGSQQREGIDTLGARRGQI